MHTCGPRRKAGPAPAMSVASTLRPRRLAPFRLNTQLSGPVRKSGPAGNAAATPAQCPPQRTVPDTKAAEIRERPTKWEAGPSETPPAQEAPRLETVRASNYPPAHNGSPAPHLMM